MKKPEAAEPGTADRAVRKRNPDESRRRILDAAEHAFARRGFDGARLRDIAHEAGVHHALVHHYYGDKRGLFKEVVHRALSAISTTGIESVEGAVDLPGAATQLVSLLFDFFSTHKDLLGIIEGAFRDKDSIAHQLTASAMAEIANPLLVSVRQRVIEGQRHNIVRQDLSADAMLACSFAIIVYPFVTGQDLMTSLGVRPVTEDDRQARKTEMIQYIIGAMRPQNA
jgi:TetR/AcrR family transcriptional regulator